jgi:hypothetical protein
VVGDKQIPSQTLHGRVKEGKHGARGRDRDNRPGTAGRGRGGFCRQKDKAGSEGTRVRVELLEQGRQRPKFQR